MEIGHACFLDLVIELNMVSFTFFLFLINDIIYTKNMGLNMVSFTFFLFLINDIIYTKKMGALSYVIQIHLWR